MIFPTMISEYECVNMNESHFERLLYIYNNMIEYQTSEYDSLLLRIKYKHGEKQYIMFTTLQENVSMDIRNIYTLVYKFIHNKQSILNKSQMTYLNSIYQQLLVQNDNN